LEHSRRLDDTLVKHPEGVKNDFHAALLDHVFRLHLFFTKLKLTFRPSKKSVGRINALRRAVRGIHGVPIYEVDETLCAAMGAFQLQQTGTIVSTEYLKDIG
jgi:hypothetical protein